MSKKTPSTQSNAQARSKPNPVRGVAVNQSSMLRKFGSSSDLSRCSDSSSEDVYLSANEDEPCTKSSNSRRCSSVSNRSLSPVGGPRMRSSSAEAIPNQKDNMSPSSNGRTSPGLLNKCNASNSLSKSLNFGSRELKSDKNVNKMTLAPNKLLPDKPKIFQRSISSAACLESDDSQHRPIICGKDRKKLSASVTLARPFDELPEPQPDADLFEQMEMLFEEYRKLELGLQKLRKEKEECKKATANSTKMKEGQGQNQQRGRRPNRDNSSTPNTAKSMQRQPSPSPSQKSITAISKPNKTSTKSKQHEKTSSALAQKETVSEKNLNDPIKLAPRSERAPSPSRMKTRSSDATPTNQQESLTPKMGLSPRSRSPVIASPRNRPLSPNPLISPRQMSPRQLSARPPSPTVARNGSQKSNAGVVKPLPILPKPSPTGSMQSLSSSTSSVNMPTHPGPKNSHKATKTYARSSSPVLSPRSKFGGYSYPSSTNTSHIQKPSKQVISQKISDVPRIPNSESNVSEASLKMKTNSGSNLRRSFECLTKPSKKEAEKTNVKGETKVLESSVDSVGETSSSKTGTSKTKSLQRNRSPSPSRKLNTDTCSKQSKAPDFNNSRVDNTGTTGTSRTSRPGTPTFGQKKTPGFYNDTMDTTANKGTVKTSRPATPTFGQNKLSTVRNGKSGSPASATNVPKTNTFTPIKIQNTSNVAKNTNSAQGRSSSSGIPTSPRGRISDKSPNENMFSPRRSISLQRMPSSTSSNKGPTSPILQKPSVPLSAKSNSSVCVNKVGESRPKPAATSNRFLSGSHPELVSPRPKPRPHMTRMDAVHIQSPTHSQEDITIVPSQKTRRRCQSAQEAIPSRQHSQTSLEDKEAQTNFDSTDLHDILLATDNILSTPRKDDRGGPRTRIPQPIGFGSNSKIYTPRQLNRCDSGVEINSMSPTESHTNEHWQETFDFQTVNDTFDDSDDEYY